MFRRPGNVDECVSMIQNASERSRVFLDPSNTDHFSIWKAISILEDAQWTDNLIRPLYTETMLCEIGMNAFVPTLLEILCNPEKVCTQKNERMDSDVRKSLVKLRAACEEQAGNGRKSLRMRKMIRVLNVMSSPGGDMEHGLLAMHRSSKVARLFWEALIPKLVETITNDDDIKKSSDVPNVLFM